MNDLSRFKLFNLLHDKMRCCLLQFKVTRFYSRNMNTTENFSKVTMFLADLELQVVYPWWNFSVIARFQNKSEWPFFKSVIH